MHLHWKSKRFLGILDLGRNLMVSGETPMSPLVDFDLLADAAELLMAERFASSLNVNNSSFQLLDPGTARPTNVSRYTISSADIHVQ